jgi:hypothetical protein
MNRVLGREVTARDAEARIDGLGDDHTATLTPARRRPADFLGLWAATGYTKTALHDMGGG